MSPEVQIAVVVTSGGIITAAITGITTIITKRANKKLDDKVGNPNGYGDITTMLELIIDNTKALTHRMDNMDRESKIRSIAVSRLTKQVQRIEERINAS